MSRDGGPDGKQETPDGGRAEEEQREGGHDQGEGGEVLAEEAGAHDPPGEGRPGGGAQAQGHPAADRRDPVQDRQQGQGEQRAENSGVKQQTDPPGDQARNADHHGQDRRQDEKQDDRHDDDVPRLAAVDGQELRILLYELKERLTEGQGGQSGELEKDGRQRREHGGGSRHGLLEDLAGIREYGLLVRSMVGGSLSEFNHSLHFRNDSYTFAFESPRCRLRKYGDRPVADRANDWNPMKSSLTSTVVLAVGLLLISAPAHAYIDPGTGSFLIQGIIAAVVGVGVVIRLFWHKIKAAVTGKPIDHDDDE